MKSGDGNRGTAVWPVLGDEGFRDIEKINVCREYAGKGQIEPDAMVRRLCCKSRDNARAPAQQEDSENARFDTGTP